MGISSEFEFEFEFEAGDVVHATYVMLPRLKRINDKRPDYAAVSAIMLGPMVLGGLTEAENAIVADPAKVADWVVWAGNSQTGSDSGSESESGSGAIGDSSGSGLDLVAVGENRNYTLVPLNRLVLENYTVYFNVTG
jgi:hypothetical protein